MELSNYTFSNKFNNSKNCTFSEQNTFIINNNTNINIINDKNQTNNLLNISYYNNNNQTNINFNNQISNNISNNNLFNNNTNILNENYLFPNKKLTFDNYDDKNQKYTNLKEEYTKIKNIMNNDPSINQNLKPQDCFDIYGYPFITPNENYAISQFNNAFKQKYLMKTLFDNKYIYINGKQYHRIMKRREVRKKLYEANQMNKNKMDKNKKYHHESRHRHAMNRERGKGGRFVSKVKQDNEESCKSKNDNKEKEIENIENEVQNNNAFNDKKNKE